MSGTAPKHSLLASQESAGERLDRWLVVQLPDLTRNRIQKLIADAHVLVDDKPRPARYRLRGGERVEVQIPPVESNRLTPEADVPFEIVFEDAHLAVIEKPAGVVVHPAPGHRQGTLVHGLLARLDGVGAVGGVERPGLVHRLDKDTSGLLVVGKSDATLNALQDMLRRRDLHRSYRAICWGCPSTEEGEIDAPLGRHPRDRKRRAVREGGRAALTRYRLDERLRGSALLSLQLTTGRTHQIRVHLAHIGRPVLGDEMYGGGSKRLRGAAPEDRPRLERALAALGRQALHAHRLAFAHPISGEELSFESPLPAEFEAALKLLRPS